MKNLNLSILFILSFLFSYSQGQLPDVELNTLDGKKVKLIEQLNEEGPTIISLWATWCVPCLKELDAISEVYEDWQSETNVKLIAISIDDSRTVKRVKPLINGKGWDYEILLDVNTDLKRALNATNIPLTIIVKDHKIVYEHMSYVPGAEDELYDKIKNLK